MLSQKLIQKYRVPINFENVLLHHLSAHAVDRPVGVPEAQHLVKKYFGDGNKRAAHPRYVPALEINYTIIYIMKNFSIYLICILQ